MSKDISTSFPSSIDDRIFFQDVNLTQVNAMENYQQLILENKYTEASEFLDSTNIDYYGAWVLNLLENRLIAIENYINTKTKPTLVIVGGEEPTEANSHWIE